MVDKEKVLMNNERKLLNLLAGGTHPAIAIQTVSNNNREKRALELMSRGISLPNAWAAVNKINSKLKLQFYALLRQAGMNHNKSLNVANRTNLNNLFSKINKKSNVLNRLTKYIQLRAEGHNHNMALSAVI